MCYGLTLTRNKQNRFKCIYACNVLLAASKKSITRKRYKAESPKSKDWPDIVNYMCSMEKMTYTLRLQQPMFKQNWEKWLAHTLIKLKYRSWGRIDL